MLLSPHDEALDLGAWKGNTMEFSHSDIIKLLDFVEQGNVEFLELKYGELHIVADRTPGATRMLGSARAVAEPSAPVSNPVREVRSAPEVAPDASPASAPVVSPVAKGGDTIPVLSPMVGVFYRAPEPGAAPYVNVGDRVESGQQVGIIEVMKVFTAVSAGTSGVVTEILAENESFVEFNAELMRISPDQGR